MLFRSPGAHGSQVAEKMPVDWRAMTQEGNWTTNYQLFPGDRIFIKADPLNAADSFIPKITVPVSRLFGFALQGNGTVRPLRPKMLSEHEAVGEGDSHGLRIASNVFTIASSAGNSQNQTLARQIITAIKAEELFGLDIEIDIAVFVATLTGIVATVEYRAACERAAGSVPGISRVDNRLTVQDLWANPAGTHRTGSGFF